MTACWNVMGAISTGGNLHGIDSTKTHFYVPTGTGIDRWTYPGFVRTADWHVHAGGIQSLAVDSDGTIFHIANTGGHLWSIEEDGTGETDIAAVTVNDIVFSPHENCLYGINGNALVRITPAGTQTTIYTGSAFAIRPTVQRGGPIWYIENFNILHRFDPDASYAHTSVSISFGQYAVPACPGKAGVIAGGNFYAEGIVSTPVTCSPWLDLFPVWNSDYSLILGDDNGSGSSQVYLEKCGARPPLRIRQRNDDLTTGSPRIEPHNRSSSMQRSLRIYGPNSFA